MLCEFKCMIHSAILSISGMQVCPHIGPTCNLWNDNLWNAMPDAETGSCHMPLKAAQLTPAWTMFA